MKLRYPADTEKELLKFDIIWRDPFGYVKASTETEESAEPCTVKEVEKAIDTIVDNKLMLYGINPKKIKS